MNTNELPDVVEHYVAELSGNRADDAWHSLVELGAAALPYVVQAFETKGDRRIAVPLVRVVNEYRTKDGLPFLARVLRGATAPDLWKTALDGFVAIGDDAAIQSLHGAWALVNAEKQTWIREAIDQIRASAG